MIFKGFNQGVDFSGGRNYIVRFDQPVKTADVKSCLAPYFKSSSLSVITIGSSNQVRVTTNYKVERQQ